MDEYYEKLKNAYIMKVDTHFLRKYYPHIFTMHGLYKRKLITTTCVAKGYNGLTADCELNRSIFVEWLETHTKDEVDIVISVMNL